METRLKLKGVNGAARLSISNFARGVSPVCPGFHSKGLFVSTKTEHGAFGFRGHFDSRAQETWTTWMVALWRVFLKSPRVMIPQSCHQ